MVSHTPLKRARLPIPPRSHLAGNKQHYIRFIKKSQVPLGKEIAREKKTHENKGPRA